MFSFPRAAGNKKNLGFVRVHSRPVLHCDTEAPLCQIPLLSLLWESRHSAWRRVAMGASEETHAVYGGAARQTGINISSVCSLFSGCREGRQWHVTGWGAPARALQGEAGTGRGPDIIISDVSCPLPLALEKSSLCDGRLVSVVQAPHPARFCLLGPSFSYVPSTPLLLGVRASSLSGQGVQVLHSMSRSAPRLPDGNTWLKQCLLND